MTRVSIWLHVGTDCGGSGEGVTETAGEAAVMVQAGEDGGRARVGAAEREKWVGYVSVLKVEPTGLADGLGVK